MSPYKDINNMGDVYWYKQGTRILHREDGPAVISKNGESPGIRMVFAIEKMAPDMSILEDF